MRRQSVTSLNKSGLRGSGRAVLEALRGVESDFRANAIDTNLNRRDTASRQLAGENFNATGNAARIDASTGRTVGDAEVGKAVVTGNADTANAGLRGSAIGDIAGIIASEEKVKGRGSKYGSDDDDDNRQVEVSRA